MQMVLDFRLGGIVQQITYRPGWRFWVAQQATGVTELAIDALVPDSSCPEREILVRHSFLAPPGEITTRDGWDWERWVLDRCLDVERHEAMEWFAVAGEKPFYPPHGPGVDLYTVRRAS